EEDEEEDSWVSQTRLQHFENGFHLGMERQELRDVARVVGEARSVYRSEDAADDFARGSGAVGFRKNLKHISTHDSRGGGRIMRRTGSAHGIDRRSGKRGSVPCPGGAAKAAALANQGTPRGPSVHDFGMLLQITSAPIPIPQPGKGQCRGQLDDRKK